VIDGPGRAEVRHLEVPEPGPGEVVVQVRRAGICGTDIEFFTGEMQYLHDGNAEYPMRIGHEWVGIVTHVGPQVDPGWIGLRVTGDTMLGCQKCERCRSGYHHVCAERYELGVKGGRPGALAEFVCVPTTALHRLPESMTDLHGAMVEPGGNAWRSVNAAALEPGERLLILGPGTIGLLCALFARALGVEVHLLGRSGRSLEFARTLDVDGVWTQEELPSLPWHAVIDASNAADLPARAVEMVEPGRRVVYVGLAGSPSLVDTRALALADVTAVGILGASAGLDPAIDAFASGAVDPAPLVSVTVALEQLPAVLGGWRPDTAGPGPKIHVDLTLGTHGKEHTQ
jgi:threonine dehydrogenase-like Zn-dependent dehydrogenase